MTRMYVAISVTLWVIRYQYHQIWQIIIDKIWIYFTDRTKYFIRKHKIDSFSLDVHRQWRTIKNRRISKTPSYLPEINTAIHTLLNLLSTQVSSLPWNVHQSYITFYNNNCRQNTLLCSNILRIINSLETVYFPSFFIFMHKWN